MNTFLFFILCILVFIISACLSKGQDFFMLVGIFSILAFPVYLSRSLFKKAFEQIKQNQILDFSKNDTETDLQKIQKKNQEKKYKNYNYSYDRLSSEKRVFQKKTAINYTVDINKRLDSYEKYKRYIPKDINEIKMEEYRKNHQSEYISQLKVEYFEEYQKEPNFEMQKQVIFAPNEDDFNYNNDYQTDEHQGEREYFIFNKKWAFFDFNDDVKKYKLIICDNKVFYTECCIDDISRKTKKLLNFINKNPDKIEFFEADLKNQEKILKTGVKIECRNCDYTYFSDNKKCSNCGYLTKDTLEE